MGAKDHFYTTNQDEIGTNSKRLIGKHGYIYEGIAFRLLGIQVAGTTGLDRYWNPESTDHFYTTDYCEMEERNPYQFLPEGYKREGEMGFCFCEQVDDTVPLHRYFNKDIKDHFYTTNFEELAGGKNGYSYQGVQCYVIPA